jgi:hypothetical protein
MLPRIQLRPRHADQDSKLLFLAGTQFHIKASRFEHTIRTVLNLLTSQGRYPGNSLHTRGSDGFFN